MASPNEKEKAAADFALHEEQLMQSLVKKEIFSKKALGVSEQDAKLMYAKAKQLYESGKYKEARTLFSTLTLLEKNVPAYIYGLATSSFMLNDDSTAIDGFLQYGALVPTDPMPYYYLSLCYELKNDLASALIALQVAMTRAANQPQYQELKTRAKMAIDNLSKKLCSGTSEKTSQTNEQSHQAVSQAAVEK